MTILRPGLPLLLLLSTIALVCPSTVSAGDAKKATGRWQAKLATELPLLGHRNWIVIADSAYPAQSRDGIDTIYIGGDQATAVTTVLKMIDKAKHVRAITYLDAELKSVPESDAPGVERYRSSIKTSLSGMPVRTELHESTIAKLDEAAKTFRVIILKTDCTIPYTTVFIELDCGYWNARQEERLRKSLLR